MNARPAGEGAPAAGGWRGDTAAGADRRAGTTARLVVVEGTSGGRADAATGGGARRERRAADRLLADAARAAAFEQMRAVGALLWALIPVPWLVAGAAATHGPRAAPAAWALACAAFGALLWVRPRRLARRTQPAMLAALTGVAAALAALPAWIGGFVHPPAWVWVAALFAVVTAAWVAPSIPAVAAAATAPLLAAAAGVATGASSPWPAALLAALAALAAAWRTRRRWQRLVRALTERAQQLGVAQTERDAALRADADKSRFLAIASHDLRQPVHALGLFAATLHRRLHASPDETLARNLMRSVDALERSFSAMLDISRLDGGALAPRLTNFPLRDLFRRLHMQFGGQAELAGLALRFSPGGKRVTSDPQLLERIVGNLVQNAIRYTTSGGVVVVARSTRSHVNVEVWDTGSGIAAEKLPRIFDEFYQVGRGERDRRQGLGMGLAIVKRLAALLGHRLEVASTAGRGTMFRVGIALGELPGIEEEMAAADTVPMAVEVSQMVLVVDDEEPIREGLRLLLQEWGYQVMTAADAEQAERAVSALEGRVDLVLSDLHLGAGAGGQEVVGSVRRLCGRDVPAILVTGDTAGEALREVVAGTDPVLFKPVQPRQLFDALKAALEHAPASPD